LERLADGGLRRAEGLDQAAVPEIIEHGGQLYMAALLPSLKGIQIARLRWAWPPAQQSCWKTCFPSSPYACPTPRVQQARERLSQYP